MKKTTFNVSGGGNLRCFGRQNQIASKNIDIYILPWVTKISYRSEQVTEGF